MQGCWTAEIAMDGEIPQSLDITHDASVAYIVFTRTWVSLIYKAFVSMFITVAMRVILDNTNTIMI